MSRKDAFHPDPNLPKEIRSELSDYVRSGYDRGHMAPSGDMPTPSSQAESFSLANMAPQLHANNAGIWEKFENGTRNLAYAGHDVYMVSGPLFEGQTLQRLKERVLIPTGFFKAVYDATSGQAGVFVTGNGADQRYELISVDELAKRAGIDAFPGLPPKAKAGRQQVINPDKKTDCEGR
jgi:endonuclease G